MEYRELWYRNNGKTSFRIKNLEENGSGNNRLVIKSIYSLVSAGTERTLLTEKINSETADAMRVPYMQGGFHNEFTYGYSLVGEVVSGPAGWKNRIVHLLHPHQEVAVALAQDVYPVPASINPRDAVLASNLETAINAIWDSGISLGDRVLFVGAGMIGLLTAWIAGQFPGIDPVICDPDKKRREIAGNIGFKCTGDPSSAGKEFTHAFHTSGTSEGLRSAIDSVGMEGKIIEMSWYGTRPVELKLGDSFHNQRKQIISSQVSHIPGNKSLHFNYSTRKEIVFKLLADKNSRHFIQREIPFEMAPEFYRSLVKNEIDEIGTVFKY